MEYHKASSWLTIYRVLKKGSGAKGFKRVPLLEYDMVILAMMVPPIFEHRHDSPC